MKYYNKWSMVAFVHWLTIFVFILLGYVLRKTFYIFPYCHRIGTILYAAAGLQVLGRVIYWCYRHNISRGIPYAFTHARYSRRITNTLVAAGKEYALVEENQYLTPPEVKLSFNENMTEGEIRLRNHTKYDTILENINLTPAIGRYRIVEKYTTDDGNFWVYLFEDSRLDNRLVFQSYEDFRHYVKKSEDYSVVINAKHTLPLASTLLTGTTGSGKTYAAYSVILQMLSWGVKPVMYFADPKNSSLYIMGRHIDPERTAGTPEDIITLLERFYNAMQERKVELQPYLEEKLDSTYKDWHLPSHVLFLDETSAFVSCVNSLDKATRDKVWKMLRSITLEGRQLGFVLFLLTQKADSTDIPTQIRDNLVFKACLGNCPSTTYLTTFEKAADLPKRKFGPGEGLFTYQGITRDPQVISFPTLKFDVLAAVKKEVMATA